MKIPVQKVKFVCQDKHDTSLFAVILATDRVTSESQRLHRLFCYQADHKIVSVDAVFVYMYNTYITYIHVRVDIKAGYHY